MTTRADDQGPAPVLVLAPKTEPADLQNELDTTARLPGPAQGLIPLLANRASMAVVTPPAQGPEPFLRDRGLAPETETVAADHIAPSRGRDQIIGRGVEVARIPMTEGTVVIIRIPLAAGDTAVPGLTLDLDPARLRSNAVGLRSTRKSASLLLRWPKG